MSDLETVLATLERVVPTALVRSAPLGPLTTYRVGGSAAGLVRVANGAELECLASAVAGRGVDLLVVGRGSNLLVADGELPLIVIELGEHFAEVAIDGTTVEAGGAAKLPVVARTSVQHGLTGFEWAVGVPGSIGGAVRMNAGGHGAAMADSVIDVDVLDLRTAERTTRPGSSLDFGYRRSAISDHHVVVGCRLALAEGDPNRGSERIGEIVRWRREHQPGGQNAGSVFTNPAGESAGRLIDLAGGRGLRVGSAMVSTKHANFIQADEDGSAADVVALMVKVWELVREVHHVSLHPETILVGFDDMALPWRP